MEIGWSKWIEDRVGDGPMEKPKTLLTTSDVDLLTRGPSLPFHILTCLVALYLGRTGNIKWAIFW
jgi:hypothetical protein